MSFGPLDALIFVVYIAASIVFAMWMSARQGKLSAQSYFKADKQIPWYVVGASIISSGVSSEQFIGTVGIAYLYGMALANWQWGAPITYTLLIFIFLPFYVRGNVTTMPEFLERRFNSVCRKIYAVVSIINMAFILLGVTLFAGAKALNVLFPDHVSVITGIFILAIASGTYTVYGGLLSSVWADFLQYIVLMGGGIMVSVFALNHAGGLGNLLDQMPEKAIMLYDSEHEVVPWFGLLAIMFSVGLWYSCANQMIVQRFLSARSEWDARMGVIMAGFSMAIFPLLVVIPGIAAFYLFHDELGDGDRSWPYLVKSMLPTGVIGIVMAGLASSILGTLSAVVNSASTIFTYDVYKPILRKNATDKELFLTGRVSAVISFAIGIGVAILLSGSTISIFVMIQSAFSYMAAPIAAVFLIGILWKRATPAAATITLIAGFASIYPVVKYLFKIDALRPYDSFAHHTFVVFLFSMILLVALSMITKPKSAEELKDVIWNKSALNLPPEEKRLNRGIRDFRLWWLLMILTITTLYVITYSRANNTEWLEAEKQKFATLTPGSARIQHRNDLKTDNPDAVKANFTMWTNSRQLLFTPASTTDTLTITFPAEKAGNHTVAIVVSRGPGYGSFSAQVNGTPADIAHNVTHADGTKFIVNTNHSATYDANTSSGPSLLNAPAGRQVMDRLNLGNFPLTEGDNTITFTPTVDKPGLIGVDQIVLTPVKE